VSTWGLQDWLALVWMTGLAWWLDRRAGKIERMLKRLDERVIVTIDLPPKPKPEPEIAAEFAKAITGNGESCS
jgi:hypothetical protein